MNKKENPQEEQNQLLNSYIVQIKTICDKAKADDIHILAFASDAKTVSAVYTDLNIDRNFGQIIENAVRQCAPVLSARIAHAEIEKATMFDRALRDTAIRSNWERILAADRKAYEERLRQQAQAEREAQDRLAEQAQQEVNAQRNENENC